MSLNAFFNGVDSVERSGRFFVEMTRRLGDGEIDPGDDVTRLSRTLGIALPSELAGASIVSMASDEVARLATQPGTEILVSYPPETCPPGQVEKTFKRCFQVCKTVSGAKICAKVCVEINVGLSGVSGEVNATVSVKF